MATFGKSTFNAVSYAASRPTYPRALFEHVFRFHAGGTSSSTRWDTAVDLGCGTGQATIELTPFKKIVGVDPSTGMIEAARHVLAELSSDSAVVQAQQPDRITYVQSDAEKLPFLSDGSVDLIISAQAGHWFNWSKMWLEAARVLRKDGTFAMWNYSELRLPRYPTLTPQLTHFFQGTDPKTSIGPYWQQPGRSIVEQHLVPIPDAREVIPGAFKDFTRTYFTGTYYPHLPSPQPVLMRKRMTWNDLHAYFRTASALHTFLEKNPEDAMRPEGDLAMRFWKALMKDASEVEAQDCDGRAAEVHAEQEVEVEWPLALILVRKA